MSLQQSPVNWASTSNWTGAVNSDFNADGNWDAGVPKDIAGFNTAGPPSLTLSTNTALNGFTFNNGASAYTILIGTSTLSINGPGINNRSNSPETFSANAPRAVCD